MKEIKIAVTGGRSFGDWLLITNVLSRLKGKNITLAHGDASGADALCKEFACQMGWRVVAFPAAWKVYGKRAGPIRNAKLLDTFKPDYLIVFPGNIGTQDMVNKAVDRKIKIVYAVKLQNKGERK